jgi:hypothetical protein
MYTVGACDDINRALGKHWGFSTCANKSLAASAILGCATTTLRIKDLTNGALLRLTAALVGDVGSLLASERTKAECILVDWAFRKLEGLPNLIASQRERARLEKVGIAHLCLKDCAKIHLARLQRFSETPRTARDIPLGRNECQWLGWGNAPCPQRKTA